MDALRTMHDKAVVRVRQVLFIFLVVNQNIAHCQPMRQFAEWFAVVFFADS